MGNTPKVSLPQSKVVVREDATVYATCGHGRITPLAVYSGERLSRVETITRTWMGKHRAARLFYFEVTADQRPLKLCFNTGEVLWMVEELRGGKPEA
ncbi:MAG: hypothetical protein ACYDBB_12600 [Armatimonadota bacterium]